MSISIGVGIGPTFSRRAAGGAPPPVNTVAPTLTGTPNVGATLTLSFGTFTGAVTTDGRIERSADGVTGWTAVTSYGASTSYVVQPADRPFYLRTAGRGTNGGGSTVVGSTAVGKIVLPDADAEAYVAAVEVADAQLLEVAVVTAMANLVATLKSTSQWTPLGVAIPGCGPRTLAGYLIGLKSATQTVTNVNFVGGDYDRKLGLLGNGTSKYLNLNRNVNADPQDSQHLAVLMSTYSPNGLVTGIMGAGAGVIGASTILTNSTGFSVHRSHCLAGTTSTPPIAGPDFVGINRDNSANYNVRYDGATAVATEASQSPFNASMFAFARNHTTTNPAPWRFAWLSAGAALTLSTLETTVKAYRTAIGAAIP